MILTPCSGITARGNEWVCTARTLHSRKHVDIEPFFRKWTNYVPREQKAPPGKILTKYERCMRCSPPKTSQDTILVQKGDTPCDGARSKQQAFLLNNSITRQTRNTHTNKPDSLTVRAQPWVHVRHADASGAV